MTTSSNHEALAAISEERRPGIKKLAKQIAQAHPEWSLNRVLCEAKVRWHEQNKQR